MNTSVVTGSKEAMKRHEKKIIESVLAQMRELESHIEHGEVHFDLLKALQETSSGWAGQMAQAMLKVFSEAKHSADAERALEELASIALKWSLILQRERMKSSLELEVGDEVLVSFPERNLRYRGVVLEDRLIEIEFLDQVVSMNDVFIRKIPREEQRSQALSHQLQRTVNQELSQINKKLFR